MTRAYRQDIDSIKGIAIIAVVLFHLGLLKSGYLGVDAFFVINGFFVIPAVVRGLVSNSFSYREYITKRTMRLYPLILFATAVCLIVGYIGMLPDNYENVGQAVVASNLMSENILSAITTHDYWNVANDYNPLMHLWYVGILFEFYVLLPVLLWIPKKLFKQKDSQEGIKNTLYVLTSISLVLYLIPSDANKFYFLQYRFFELGFGGILALNYDKVKETLLGNRKVKTCAFALFVIFIISSLLSQDYDSLGCQPIVVNNDDTIRFDDGMLMPRMILLIGTVALTFISLSNPLGGGKVLNNKILAWFGKMSFSIFIWHQIILAFYRYFVTNEISILFLLFYFSVVLLVSYVTFLFVEQKTKTTRRNVLISLMLSLLLTSAGIYVYMKAGVVRDVPELNIKTDNVHRGMHGEYCDRIYSYDKEFPNEKNGKINVLVVGISYGRDMANVILESEYADSVNLSYIYKWDEKFVSRVKEADYIFTFQNNDKVPDYVWGNAKSREIVYGIGSKHFGLCNGVIYSHRFAEDYYQHTEPLHPIYAKMNEDWKLQWGDHYVDFIGMSTLSDGSIRVFTDEKKYISQDCYHLTQAGARWFANQIEWNKYFK